MDKIIRAAAVSAHTRQLRKPVAPTRPVAPPATNAPVTPPRAVDTPVTQAFVAAHAPLPDRAEMDARKERDDEQAVELAAELAALRTKAEKDGYAAGLESGRIAAQESAQDSLDALRGKLVALTASLADARQTALAAAEDDIVEVVFTACSRIIGSAAVAPATIADMVRHVLEPVIERRDIEIHLHPDDLVAMVDIVGAQTDLTWKADASIVLGGCTVHSAAGTLDARLETQLAGLRDTLLVARLHRDSGSKA